MDYSREIREARDETVQDRPSFDELVTLTCGCENETDREWVSDDGDDICLACGEMVVAK